MKTVIWMIIAVVLYWFFSQSGWCVLGDLDGQQECPSIIDLFIDEVKQHNENS